MACVGYSRVQLKTLSSFLKDATMAATTKSSRKIAVLLFFHAGHVVQKRRSALWLSRHNDFHAKAKNKRFIAVGSRCCQNLKYENFTLSSDRLRQQSAPKHVLHVRHALLYNSLTYLPNDKVKFLILGSLTFHDGNVNEKATNQ